MSSSRTGNRMPYLTILLLVSIPLLLEWLFATTAPHLWYRPRWFVLPLLNGAIAWWLPLRILPAVPSADLALSLFLGIFLGLLVAVGGHFADTFWRGPDEAEVARTGMRSLYDRPRTR